MGFLAWLEEHPDARGDGLWKTEEREVLYKEVGHNVISWWLDAPVSQIMVVDIVLKAKSREKVWNPDQ